MALFTPPGGGPGVALAAHTLVGRSSACLLRLDDPLASGEHARLSFGEGAWSVRDLGSRNGTWLNGARIAAGGTRLLAAGDRIAFGNAATTWTLVDASPPLAVARRLAGEALIAAENGMLVLPSPEEPAACVFEGRDGWIAEVDGEGRPVRDGETLHIAGQLFVLHLPIARDETERTSAEGSIDDLSLSLRVSRNEERVEVAVEGPRGPRMLPRRSHHYTLLTLARARLRDERAPALAEKQRGWVFVEDLCRALAMDEAHLNVEIYRIRQDFAGLGIDNAASVVERRRGSLRLATSRLAISSII